MLFEVQENSTSSNLVFSPGSWQVAVLPSIEYWKQIKGDQTCKVGDNIIQVGGIKSGKDTTGKNVVNQGVFLADRNKIVCHLYNTTCLILVNGHGYKHFIDIFLKPFFKAKIDAFPNEIQKVNAEVIEKLGPKTVKRSSIKFKRGSSFPCNQCDYAFKSISSLGNHKQLEHVVSPKRILKSLHIL